MGNEGDRLKKDLDSKSRNELAALKGQLADTYLKDQSKVSIDEIMQVDRMIDRELDRRADAGDIR